MQKQPQKYLFTFWCRTITKKTFKCNNNKNKNLIEHIKKGLIINRGKVLLSNWTMDWNGVPRSLLKFKNEKNYKTFWILNSFMCEIASEDVNLATDTEDELLQLSEDSN